MISLHAVKRKNKIEHKQKHYEKIHEALDKYQYVFVVKPFNMNNIFLQKLRERFYDSCLFMGKNKTMARAFGSDEASEYKPNLHKISPLISGFRVIFMTNDNRDDIMKFLRTHRVLDFARAGFVPIETILRHPGPIELPHSLEPTLRKLGMPTRLKAGTIYLESEFTLCQAGKIISPEQARLLKLLDIKLAEFRLEVTAFWSNDGTYEIYEEEEEDMFNNSSFQGGDLGEDEEDQDEEEMDQSEEGKKENDGANTQNGQGEEESEDGSGVDVDGSYGSEDDSEEDGQEEQDKENDEE